MKYIKWFREIGMEDLPLVGGKNASLGEMFRALTPKGIQVPDGFAITVDAYWDLLEHNNLRERIREILEGLDTSDMEDLSTRGKRVRDLIYYSNFPEELEQEIREAYAQLCEEYGPDTDVAVRSSATAEDLPDASFAGQQDTYLNIKGADKVIDACKKCFASLFTNRAISYRHDRGFDQFSVGLSIGIQKMVRSDLACSGVMFTIDTESGFKDVVYVTATYGLGEVLVQGEVNPDEYYVFKPTLLKGYRPIVRKHLGKKQIKMIYSDKVGTKSVKKVVVPKSERMLFALSDDEILKLANWAVLIEDHYSHRAGSPRPMDVEWAKDGITNELFIVQARPETVHSQRRMDVMETYRLKQRGKVLVTGKSVGDKIGTGKVRVISSVKEMHKFQPGEVLVTEMTDPDWEPIMKFASAIVTDKGGRTCHAAIVSREMGVPAVVGAGNATEVLMSGRNVTVSCAEGDVGYVYDGILEYEVDRVDLKDLPRPKTKIMMNLGNPEEAFKYSFVPNDGVGLARLEFIINSYIKIHPLALAYFNRLDEIGARAGATPDQIEELKATIEEMTLGYPSKTEYFVRRLAEGVGTIAAAFYPEDVIVRMSDFKSNEYANLIGGFLFEPEEHNPMLGFRGASRYYHPKYRDGFALECKAMKVVRDEMGLTNVKLMIPFCRTPEEGVKVIKEMEKNGLVQGENGLQIYVMCELPVNVVLADAFSDIFDGFSIGSNDLTQLVLGVDRDSELIADIFDERNEAVKRMIAQVIEVAHRYDRKVGICGQAPSDYPEFARFLVECGIDSISLNPDTVLKGTLTILEAEGKGRGEGD
ncbi:phosphoenolpyruvate synthase [Thermoplasmatales archaeon ex4484_36]|nr:MAG: phosphoenolpyruvate synthase [Thermoplasmatales archaeon ex4484_36]